MEDKPVIPCPLCHTRVSLTLTGKLPKHREPSNSKQCPRSLSVFSEADRATSAAYCLEVLLRRRSNVKQFENSLEHLRSQQERLQKQIKCAEEALQQERERVAKYDTFTPEQLFEEARYQW